MIDDLGRLYKKYIPSYVPFLAIFTLLYLVVELSFNARLLDVTGGEAGLDQVRSIEKWGRIISGVALTLAIWGWVVYPRACPSIGSERLPWSSGKRHVVLVLVASILIPLTYLYEKKLIDHFVNVSSGEERKAAMHLRDLSFAILEGSIKVDGIDLSSATLKTPQGKAFLAIFPLFALTTIEQDDKSSSILHDVVRENLIGKMGTASQQYNKVFIPSIETLKESYNKYVDGLEAYRRALDSIPHQQLSAWNDYVNGLAERHRTPTTIPSAYWGRVANDVRQNGVDVPRNWVPYDKASFYAAVSLRVHREAKERFDSEMRRNLGAVLPFNLSWQKFTSHVAVQKKWHKVLGRFKLSIPDDVYLDPRMGLDNYTKQVWEPSLENEISRHMSVLMLDGQSFEDGAAHAEEGRFAMESLIAPPIALAFSLLGALTHIYKVLKFSSWWAFPAWPGRSYYVLFFIYSITILFMFLPTSVSTSSTFLVLSEHTRAGSTYWGSLISMGIKWTVQAQPYFYPLNEFVRRFLLFGYDFGAHLH